MIIIFALELGWVPVSGWGGIFDKRAILPAITVGLPGIAVIARLMRASTLDVLGQEFITFAKAKGVDAIICLSVNDAFVMHAWGESQNAENIMMLADGDGSYTKALGLAMDTAGFGGVRSQRYSMIIEDGIVTSLNLEKPKEFEVSKAEVILNTL